MTERSFPVDLLKLKRLWARMYPDDPERVGVEKQIRRLEAGHHGEKVVDQHLDSLRLPVAWTLLKDIRIEIREGYIAQFDTLLISERGVWIIEAKMIRGTLQWLENPRRVERTEEGGSLLTMDCPIVQLENQIAALTGWLHERKLDIPVTGIVAFVSRNTWIGLPSDAPIVTVKELRSHLRRAITDAGFQYPSFRLAARQILDEALGPDNTPAADKYQINRRLLKQGPICEHCHAELIRITRRRWLCQDCKTNPEEIPIRQALLDYFLVFSTTISNEEFCRWIGTVSHATGYRHLTQYELDRNGHTNRRRYSFIAAKHLDGTKLRKKTSE